MPGTLKRTFAAIDRKLDGIMKIFAPKRKLFRMLFPPLLFLLVLHLIYSHIGIYEHIHERPCSIHVSAQCQRASIALNYYHVDMNFFEPRIQRFNQDDGIIGVEFPIIYYTAAVLYKFFGFDETYLRAISLLIISAGLLLFYLLANSIIKNSILSLIAVGAAILSPVLLFYSANFMPDAPALGFTLGAWYFLFRHMHSEKNSHLAWFVLLATLGALIKAVSLLCFAVVLCLLILDRLNVFKKPDSVRAFKYPGKILAGILLGTATVIAWYMYAKWLSKTHGNQAFALTPIMVSDMEGLRQVWHFVRNSWLFQYYPYEAYILMASAIAFVILTIRMTNKLLLSITVLYILGSVCYVYLFLNQFMHHDYYLVAILPCVFFMMLLFVDNVRKLSLRHSYLIGAAFLIIAFFNMRESLAACRENYSFRFDSKVYLGGEYRPYYDLGPKLKALGLTRADRVVSAFDDSYSNSLYFMDQPGFVTENCFVGDTIGNQLNAPNVKYLVVSDSAKFNKAYPNDFVKNIVLVHRGLIVYKIK